MTFSILYVCTGNICRSPLAERYTVHRLTQEAPDLVQLVTVSSAGVRGLEGYPMDQLAEAELGNRGGAGGGFLARRLTASHVEAAGLVLAMTRAHRGAALTEAPSALRRTFTLLEAADLVELVHADGQLDAVPAGPAGLVAAMAGRRSQARLEYYDVADPIGRSADVHAAVADVITTAVDTVVRHLVSSLRQLTATADPAP